MSRLHRMRPGLIAVVAVLAGCSANEVDTEYGRSSDKSINGTLALRERFEAKGHRVRTVHRLNEKLDSADVLVRFAPTGGPPPPDEADWYLDWLSDSEDRHLIYVVRDYDAGAEFWSDVLANLPADATKEHRDRVAARRDLARVEFTVELPKEKGKVGKVEDWFAVEPASGGVKTASRLDGPWADGVDPKAAALPYHRPLKVNAEKVLLRTDAKPMVIAWERFRNGRVLVVANGSFLLNASLLNRARRPLTERVVGWIGPEPADVAFVEGGHVTSSAESDRTLFALLSVAPFGWIAAHLILFGVIACLARAPRLGPPRDPIETNLERPLAHPEALGSLLSRTGRRSEAESLLDAYRRWRTPNRPG